MDIYGGFALKILQNNMKLELSILALCLAATLTGQSPSPGNVITTGGAGPAGPAGPAPSGTGIVVVNSGTASAVAMSADCTISTVTGVITCTAIGGKAVTLANTLTTAGNFALTLTATGTTNVTLPTTGTLAILGANQFAGNQTLAAADELAWTGRARATSPSDGALQIRSNAGGAGLLVFGPATSSGMALSYSGTTLQVVLGDQSAFGGLKAATTTLVGAAPTVAASQVGFGGTVAASSNCGTLVTAVGCLVINVAGTTRYIPYY